jgi:hypothetical protein
MSDLRDRIIAAIRSEQTGTNEEIADAVIAELGLEEELTYGGTMRRYVTDWKADDETD